MTKQATNVLVIGGVLVIAVGGVWAFLSARAKALTALPYKGAAPPPPPPSLSNDVAVIGSAALTQGGRALSNGVLSENSAYAKYTPTGRVVYAGKDLAQGKFGAALNKVTFGLL